MIDKGHKPLLIDLLHVDYIDGTGLGMLVAIQNQARQRGGIVQPQGL